MGGGTSPAGKTKLLPGSNATTARTLWLLIALSQPGPTALRMRDENAGADPGEQRGNPVGEDLDVEGPRVRRHGPEELIERLWIARELDTVEILRPHANAKLQPSPESKTLAITGRAITGDLLTTRDRSNEVGAGLRAQAWCATEDEGWIPSYVYAPAGTSAMSSSLRLRTSGGRSVCLLPLGAGRPTGLASSSRSP